MVGIKHELLTKFLKMKSLLFHSTKTKNAFELIINFYERLQKLGIVQ